MHAVRGARRVGSLLGFAALAACSHEWEGLDPRLSGGAGGNTIATGGGATVADVASTGVGAGTSDGGAGTEATSSSGAGAAGGTGAGGDGASGGATTASSSASSGAGAGGAGGLGGAGSGTGGDGPTTAEY